MQQTYIVIPKNCTGCRTCELACSMVKGVNGSLGHSRIRVYPTKEDAHMQLTCLQCANAACAAVCPTDALKRNDATGAIEVIQDRCIGCSLCEAACPFGHLHFDKRKGLPLKCDLCSGDPACARFCPEKALELR
ncbi:MAG: 4Fe-4S dicluster domain-containing protein [Myxococcota bacterium]|nr:4Fe-4S dicluster domain-containing protein [Myxococcota bacterium]